MRKETNEQTIILVEALSNGEWVVRWDFKEKLNPDGSGTGIYWYEEVVLYHIPQMDEIKKYVLEWQNKQTDSTILHGFEWNGKKVLLNEENKFNFKSLFDLAVMIQPQVIAWDATNPELAGKDYVLSDGTDVNGNPVQMPVETGRPKSILPSTLKLGTNDAPNFHEFTTLEELTDFYLSAVNWAQECYKSGWIKNESFDYTPYQEALNTLSNQ